MKQRRHLPRKEFKAAIVKMITCQEKNGGMR